MFQPRYTIRGLMALVLFTALGLSTCLCLTKLFESPSPPGRVIRAAQRRMPGFNVGSALPTGYSKKASWELIGKDSKGKYWLIIVSDSGEILRVDDKAW